MRTSLARSSSSVSFAFGCITRVDTLRQMLGVLVISGALTILGYILNVRGGHPRLVRLCRLALGGIGFGFAAGLVVSSYSDDFTGWLSRQHFVPLRFQEFIVTHDPDICYALLSAWFAAFALP